mgnify:CR=1 FL=1
MKLSEQITTYCYDHIDPSVVESWSNHAATAEQENEKLKAENLKLHDETMSADKQKVRHLSKSNNRLRKDKISLHLIIAELRLEITKMNKGMGRKNRKIARLQGEAGMQQQYIEHLVIDNVELTELNKRLIEHAKAANRRIEDFTTYSQTVNGVDDLPNY